MGEVKYDGEFVLAESGSKDFGELPQEIATAIKRQAGKIRLRIGRQNNENGDYGEKHIERPERIAQLRKAGFKNARNFISFVCGAFDEIYSSGTRLMLTKADGGHTCIIELKPYGDADFYDVITALIIRRKSIESKAKKQKIKLLWRKP